MSNKCLVEVSIILIVPKWLEKNEISKKPKRGFHFVVQVFSVNGILLDLFEKK